MTERLKLEHCEQCQELRPLTCLITSEIIRARVCSECAYQADQVNKRGHGPGAMTITPLLDCRACGDQFETVPAIEAHWRTHDN